MKTKSSPERSRAKSVFWSWAALICAATVQGAPLAQTAAIQTQPDNAAPVIGILKAGTEPVAATGAPPTPAGWMAVSVAGPFVGYVLNSDLTKQLDVKPGAPIRLEPKPEAGVLAVGEKDDKTHLTGLQGAWTQIRLEKTLTGYIRISPDVASPAPASGAPGTAAPGDLATAPAAVAPAAVPPQAQAAPGPSAASASSGPVDLARTFEGTFASTRRPFSPRRPFDWSLVDASGSRIAYLDISKLLLTDQIENYANHEVAVFGALKSVPGSKDPVIDVESLRLK